MGGAPQPVIAPRSPRVSQVGVGAPPPRGTMPLGQDGPSWKKRTEDIRRIYDFREVLGT